MFQVITFNKASYGKLWFMVKALIHPWFLQTISQTRPGPVPGVAFFVYVSSISMHLVFSPLSRIHCTIGPLNACMHTHTHTHTHTLPSWIWLLLSRQTSDKPCKQSEEKSSSYPMQIHQQSKLLHWSRRKIHSMTNCSLSQLLLWMQLPTAMHNHLHMHCNFSNSLTTSYIREEEEYISMTNCYATDLAFTGKGKQEWEPYRHQLPCIGHSPIAPHMKLHWHTWNNLVTKGKLP
jgi:hypothetical protein